MEKATDIEWQTMIDPSILGHRIIITGCLEDKHATFWALKKKRVDNNPQRLYTNN